MDIISYLLGKKASGGGGTSNITLDANPEGFWDGDYTKKTSGGLGDYIDLTPYSNEVNNSMYDFLGWTTVQGDASTLIQNPSSYEVIGDVTLYALFDM